MIPMTKRGNLFIPQTDNSESVKQTVVRRLSEQYGGATVRPDHEGYWTDDSGNLVKDTVDIVFTYGDIDESVLEDLASYVKEKLGEDAVMYSIEDANTGMV